MLVPNKSITAILFFPKQIETYSGLSLLKKSKKGKSK